MCNRKYGFNNTLHRNAVNVNGKYETCYCIDNGIGVLQVLHTQHDEGKKLPEEGIASIHNLSQFWYLQY